MTTDFGYRHTATVNPGQARRERKRGEVEIQDDGKTYFYSVSRGETRQFKTWAETAFQQGLTSVRIAGNRRDGYTVETR